MPRRCAPLLLLACLAARPVLAQTPVLNRTGSGARAAGMANAFVAISDDGTAASWNPAGLAQLRKPEISLVGASLGNHIRLDGFRSTDDRYLYSPSRYDYSASSIDFAAVAVPFGLFGKPVTLQLGWRRLYQFDATSDETTLRQPARTAMEPLPTPVIRRDQDTDGAIDYLSLAGGVRLTQRLLIGASYERTRGAWTDGRILAESPGPSVPTDFTSLTQENRLHGSGFAAGLLLTHAKLNVGLVYHAPVWMDYSLVRRLESTQFPTVSLSTGPGTRLRFPHSVGFGIALRPTTDWTLAADLTWDQWTRTTLDHLPESPTPVNFFDGAVGDLTSTRDTVSLSVGAERLIRGNGFVIPLRFGVAWEPQGPMDPVLRDPIDYFGVSVGSGWNTNRVKLDAAFQYRWTRYRFLDSLSVDSILTGEPDAAGQTQQREWRFKLSAIYRITDIEGLRKGLKRIFVGGS